MNKRGDIPITIFVIGVMTICILALASFYISERDFKQGFSDISVIEKIKLDKEKFYVYTESLDFSSQEAERLLGVKEDVQGKHFEERQGKIQVRYILGN